MQHQQAVQAVEGRHLCGEVNTTALGPVMDHHSGEHRAANVLEREPGRLNAMIHFKRGIDGHIVAAASDELGSHQFFAAVLLQCVAGSLVPLVVASLGGALFGRPVGRTAGWLATLHPLLVFFSGYLLTETIFTLALMLALLLSVEWVRTPRPGRRPRSPCQSGRSGRRPCKAPRKYGGRPSSGPK